MVKLVRRKIQKESVDQYKIEERSIVARRMISFNSRINLLLDCMMNDTLSTQEHIEMLREEIYNFTHDLEFRRSEGMGSILKNALDFVKRNYQGINMKNFL